MTDSGSTISFGYDFFPFYAFGELARTGQNPYDLQALSSAVISLHRSPPTALIWQLGHPPWSVAIYAPLSLLPFETARFVWLILQVLGLAGATLVITRMLLVDASAEGRAHSRYHPLFAAAIFPPFYYELLWGQVNFVVLLGLILALRSIEQRRFFLAGMALALTMFKPQGLLGVYPIIAIQTWRAGALSRLAVGAVVSLAAFCGISYPISPVAFTAYPGSISSFGAASTTLPGATLTQITSHVPGLAWLAGLFPLIGIAAGVRWGLSRGGCVTRMVFGALPFSLLCAPYGWSHYFILLAPTYLQAFRNSDMRSLFPTRAAVLLGLLTAAVTMGLATVDFINIWIPLAIWLFHRRSVPELLVRQEAPHLSSHPSP